MKRITAFSLVLLFILTSCGSSKKQLEKGNYAMALDKAVKQLRRNRNDSKQISILDRSYKILNDQDNERIRFLKMEARPENWDEIYQLNKAMSDRQAYVRTVLPLELHGRTIDYPYVDYLPEMVAAKRKSADFYYAHGNELMETKLKENYRQAFYEFLRAKEYVGNYEGIDDKIEEARYLGISRALISLNNRSIIRFDSEFEEELLSINLPALNSEWVEYHIYDPGNQTAFDYFVNVNIRNVMVSPDQTMQKDTVVKKDVEDGFTYQLDSRGNVMKDSLGNDIKTVKYKTLQCALIETIQSKSCMISGDIEIIQGKSGKLEKKDPIGAESGFEWISARALGDIQALSPAQIEKTKTKAVPFPSDMEMIFRCSEALKQAINNAIRSNKRFII
ncbi:MAG TPA: hypothetical protein PK727_04265 [Bacteroidales bacterium]|jgi:hypothetical protein|nr:hypothetical protein [Bacteroidales bacterium]HNY53080.1 hypothetical protein [Bacteroidales bacterium]HOG56523.1 hypothetical protein [Bacteroidales bacterium]HPV16648.1 hypothetical protein [Bacteroidales bacterium]HPX43561.1 hypothetical protein [Bacteroidales bacterium]